MTDQPKKISWHSLLAQALKELMSPVDIQVLTEVQVTSEPPKADIILLRREGNTWTIEQLNCLADGLRDTDAEVLMIEFKYTESITSQALKKLIMYETLYQESEKLNQDQFRSFLISSKTPNTDILKRTGFESTGKNGVYASEIPCFETINVILLNEIDDTPHNAVFKCFASRQKEKNKAFDTMEHDVLPYRQTADLASIIAGIMRVMMEKTLDDSCVAEWTPDDIMEIGRKWIDSKVVEANLQKGRQEGRQEEAASMLLRLLQRKYGSVPSRICEKITKADLATLEEWSLRFVDAQSLKDVFQS